MLKAIDKHLILILGLLFPLGSDGYVAPVIAFLVALITMEALIYFENEYVVYGVITAYAIGCIAFPALVFYLPVHIYELIYRKKWWGYAFCILYFAELRFFTESWQMCLWPLLILLATLLAYRTELQQREHKALIELKDTMTEEQRSMRTKNKELLEKQDYEIRVATLSERNRIAREIHDNVGHMLSRCILQVGALMVVHKNNEGVYNQLSSVNESLNEAMNNIRESVHDLHDESVDMKQSILEATSEMKKNYDVRVDYDMTDSVPRNVKYALIAIVKEAMANIVKHSNATKITIMLREHPGFYQLMVEDNGTVVNKNMNPGIGLSNMTDRVEALGGTINFRTDSGFVIMVSIRKEGE